jgi:hypothetical protein
MVLASSLHALCEQMSYWQKQVVGTNLVHQLDGLPRTVHKIPGMSKRLIGFDEHGCRFAAPPAAAKRTLPTQGGAGLASLTPAGTRPAT